MVETINPVVHGDRRTGWALDVTLHVLGATLAAAAFGAALGGIGALLRAPWGVGGLLLVVAAATAYGLAEAFGFDLPVPQARRQVPDWWRTFFSRPVYSFLYGVGLGIGFFTYLARGTLVVVAVAALASGRPALGALLMAPFGLTRGGSVLVASRARTIEQARALVDRLAVASRSVVWRAANAVALLAVAATAAIAIAGLPVVGIEGLAPAALAVTFGGAAAAKALAPGAWRNALAGHDLPPPLARAATYAVPVAEASVALLAIAGSRAAAAWLALASLAAFSAVVIRTWLRRGSRVPCGCFGGRRERDARVVLARNLGLAGLSAFVLAQGNLRSRIAAPEWPSGGEFLPALLALAALVFAARLAREVADAARRGRRA